MPPNDRTPLGDEMVERLPERNFPQAKADELRDKPGRADPAASDTRATPDIRHRPELPEHPERMAADIEDEEADPVIDTGPGIADGVKGLKKQRG